MSRDTAGVKIRVAGKTIIFDEVDWETSPDDIRITRLGDCWDDKLNPIPRSWLDAHEVAINREVLKAVIDFLGDGIVTQQQNRLEGY